MRLRHNKPITLPVLAACLLLLIGSNLAAAQTQEEDPGIYWGSSEPDPFWRTAEAFFSYDPNPLYVIRTGSLAAKETWSAFIGFPKSQAFQAMLTSVDAVARETRLEGASGPLLVLQERSHPSGWQTLEVGPELTGLSPEGRASLAEDLGTIVGRFGRVAGNGSTTTTTVSAPADEIALAHRYIRRVLGQRDEEKEPEHPRALEPGVEPDRPTVVDRVSRNEPLVRVLRGLLYEEREHFYVNFVIAAEVLEQHPTVAFRIHQPVAVHVAVELLLEAAGLSYLRLTHEEKVCYVALPAEKRVLGGSLGPFGWTTEFFDIAHDTDVSGLDGAALIAELRSLLTHDDAFVVGNTDARTILVSAPTANVAVVRSHLAAVLQSLPAADRDSDSDDDGLPRGEEREAAMPDRQLPPAFELSNADLALLILAIAVMFTVVSLRRNGHPSRT